MSSKAPACPVCGRPRVAKHRPFCSVRCAQRDLGHWLKGSYRIPTNEEPGDMDGGEEDGLDRED
ncbi:MAG: DNA gyrase inhibitor YacG [Alphaproteobacteria bacterium]|nr:DNA gyrase inhibitor YacG [Alphaproteobacteria bacterium]